jgi:Mor family transcriptional regulator
MLPIIAVNDNMPEDECARVLMSVYCDLADAIEAMANGAGVDKLTPRQALILAAAIIRKQGGGYDL